MRGEPKYRAEVQRESNGRIGLIKVLILIGLLAVGGKLFYLQVLSASKLKSMAKKQRECTLEVVPRRGTIFDREGEVLAISEDAVTVYATPYLVENPAGAARKISDVIGSNPDEIERKLRNPSGFVYLARKVDKTRAEKLKRLNIEGLGFLDDSSRFYPMGETASQIIGLVDIDNRGQSGLELYYQDILCGRPGRVFFEKDASGSPIPGSERYCVLPRDGSDIYITIDKDIQAKLEEELRNGARRYGAKSASGLVMDCNNGDVLAMASFPTFNPNEREKLKPEYMRCRCLTDVFEPGSVLKIVTAAAAIEEGIVTGQTQVFVPHQLQIADMVFKDSQPKPSRQLSFAQIIAESSNVGTIQVGMMVGRRKLFEYLVKLGMRERTQIDYPGEVEGILPELPLWSGTSAATVSIGQGISITAIQLACAAGAIANGGRRIYPHFLKARMSKRGEAVQSTGGLGEQVLSARTCTELKNILAGVISPGGTGRKAAINCYAVAGKTGTAAKPIAGGRGYSGYIATFVGFAPAAKPRLVGVVVFDEPSPIWGGETAAPVFREIMSFALQHLNVPPEVGAESEK